MGAWWILFYADEDNDLVNDISKLHKVDRYIVEKHYRKMLDSINDEIKNKKKN
jgi:hypothetical protein